MNAPAARMSGASERRERFLHAARLVRRALVWIRPVRWHVVALLAGVSALTLVLVPPGALLFDVVWTRVLGGEPLTLVQARVLGVDPALAAGTPVMAPEVRRMVALRAVRLWVLFALPALFAGIGLWYYQLAILQWVNQHLRLALFDRLQTLSLRFHGDARIGDAIYRLFQDSAMVTQVVQVVLLVPLFGLGRFVFSLALVAAIDPRLALVLAATWPPLVVVAAVAMPHLARRFRAARARTSDLTASIEELLASLAIVKAYGAERWAVARFDAESRAAFRGAFASRGLLVAFDVATHLVLGGALIAATAWATLAAREGAPVLAGRLLAVVGFTTWNLGCFQFVRSHLGHGTASTGQLWRTLAQAQDVLAGLERAFAILDRAPDVADAPDATAIPPVRQGIALRGVTFAYDGERPVLSDVDLAAPIGTVTAILGPTGSGKSTLLGLCLRLFDPLHGTVSVDGVDLRHVAVASLREHVAVALQEPLLFEATVAENIRYAAPHASDEAVRAAARVACADDFIARLPAGYATAIGERGAQLSAGERSRIAIARAVLKNPEVLLLDEPTAALDPATEAALLDRLVAWGRERAIVLVTHRLSTARRAGHLVLLDEGRVVEAGVPASLAARADGRYRALVDGEIAGLRP